MKLKLRQIAWLAGVILIILASAYLLMRKTVTLEIEGQPFTITTSAWTVRGALRSAEVRLDEGDLLIPPAEARLQAGQTISLTKAARVTVLVGDQQTQILTTQRTPLDWIEEAGIVLNPDDRIFVNGQPALPDQKQLYQPAYLLEVRRAVALTVEHGSQQWTIKSTAPTVGQALWEAGFVLKETDQLNPPPETPLKTAITVSLEAAFPIEVAVDGQTIAAVTSEETVGAALAQVGLGLQGLDYSIPAETETLPSDGKISIVRVREEVVITQDTIPYETVYEAFDDLEIDHYKVTQTGQVGLKAQRIRIRTENGTEVSRIVEDEWVAREPQPRIEGYGTMIVEKTIDTPDGPITYWREVQMYATSYSPCNSGVPGRCYPYTSLGLPVKQGVVAVIYDWFIPMGRHTVYIPGYGNAIIADVGGGIPGRHWIDLGYTDEDYVPWASWVTVYFTTPVPPSNEILYVLPYK